MATSVKFSRSRLHSRTTSKGKNPIPKPFVILEPHLRSKLTEVTFFVLLVAFVVGTRFWALGSKPMHHDEAVHAYCACWLLVSGDYNYDASRHGPFQDYITALFFYLFGDSEVTARLFPAISGILLIFMVWYMRDLLGGIASLSACVLLAISPTMMYFSRYRNDMPFALAGLVFVYHGIRFIQKHRARNWFYTLVSLAWMICLKEAYLMILLVAVAFGIFYFTAKRICEINESRISLKKDNEILSIEPFRDFLRSIGRSRLVAATLLGLFVGFLMVATLFSNFFQHPEHIGGPIEALIHWSGRNVEHKIYGEFHYYIPLLIVYEFLPLGIFIWGFGRLLWHADLVRPQFRLAWATISLLVLFFVSSREIPSGVEKYLHMTRGWHAWMAAQLVVLGAYACTWLLTEQRGVEAFFLCWTLIAFLCCSYIGEKVPWVSVHIVFPLIVTASLFIQDIIGGRQTPKALFTAEVREAGRRFSMYTRSSLRRGAIVLLVVAGGTATVHVGLRLTFVNPANPAERYVFTHTTEEYCRMIREVQAIVKSMIPNSYLGYLILLHGKCEWPALWYLRDCSVSDAGEPTSQTVIFICDEKIEVNGHPQLALKRWPWIVRTHFVRRVAFRKWWRQKPLTATVARMLDVWMILLPKRYRSLRVTDAKGRPIRFGGDRDDLPNMTVEETIRASLYAWRSVLEYLLYRKEFDAYRPRYPAWGQLTVLYCVRKDIFLKWLQKKHVERERGYP